MSESAVVLNDLLSPLRGRVEDRLAQYLRLPPECPPRLAEAMSYSLLGGGKRLRPILVLLACEACGRDMEQALPAACAIEMVHTYSLVHDDLPAMDDDDLRRGRPTCHKQFDEATAILVGDGLLTLAFEILARDVQPARVAAACCADLARAAGALGMVGGQMADLEAEGRWDTPGLAAARGTRADASSALAWLESIHRRKTGQLLTCALTLGGRIAGAAPETLLRLENYGRRIGLAFQIADDLLDVSGDAVRMGKMVQKDAGHGKLTYPGVLGIDESRRKASDLVEEACRELQPLGKAARTLERLARYIIERDN